MNRTDKARVVTEYQARYTDPIEVAAGESVDVGEEDKEFSGLKWCRASDERAGWVPVELISTQGKESTVLEDYSARELSVKGGEEVTIEDARHGWLLVRNAQGQRGWIPGSHVRPF
jgi:variant SH3 domain-containing protein